MSLNPQRQHMQLSADHLGKDRAAITLGGRYLSAQLPSRQKLILLSLHLELRRESARTYLVAPCYTGSCHDREAVTLPRLLIVSIFIIANNFLDGLEETASVYGFPRR